MNIDWFTFTAQIINFVILLALLKRFLYGPLHEVMNKREEKVTSRLEEARQKLAAAEQKRETYEQKLADFEASKVEMMNTARREVEETKKEMLHQAREEIDTIQQNWEAALQSEKKTFIAELHQQTTDNIVELLNRLIQELANSTLEEQAINKFIEKLRTMDKKEEKNAIQSALDYGEGKMMVISSFPLPDDQKKQIRELLHEIFTVDVNCTFTVSSVIGFGIEIRAQGWKMGWNAKVYLEDLKKNIDDLFNSDTKIKHHVAHR
ncbi:F0F1 ATP synthase subunit B family protein [Fodinibius sediminis]|uniref:ATP synthase subunit b n=1 Tax=Fodinibius sediminis TaxID=1214077 RepID=A0A521CUG4_9BACT|nr:hypothetical protein [Fodinibius sediminis]SMO63062.1 ATP synthase F0 subcomplex B subunit [Fodinibius sediminis]